MTVSAVYYDGKSSARREVLIAGDPGSVLRITGEGVDARWALKDVRISSRVGNAARLLYFPDGSQCATTDNDGVDRLLAQLAPARWFSPHRLERSAAYAFVALVLTAVIGWGIIAHGIPALSKEVALRLPASTERYLGDDALQALDKLLLGPSALPPERQAELRALLAGIKPGLRLEVRAGRKLGANALALPAGTIVLTDELVNLAVDDQELVGVLAHEAGHVQHRHLLRLVLQNSAAAVFVALAVGDLSSLTSLAAALPTLLLQFKYSREFELEADDFALELLAARGIPGAKLAALLERIEAKRDAGTPGTEYLSTHPDTRKRAERARQAR